MNGEPRPSDVDCPEERQGQENLTCRERWREQTKSENSLRFVILPPPFAESLFAETLVPQVFPLSGPCEHVTGFEGDVLRAHSFRSATRYRYVY